MAESNKKNGGKKPAEKPEEIDAAKVESVSVVDEKEIPEGADVKDEGVVIVGDEAEVQRVMDEAKAAVIKDSILVVIPYLASAAQGRELEYAVSGWRKHFKEPHHIVIVGDYHPIVDTGDDITFIECPRVEPVEGQYTCHLDHVHKFRKVREMFPDHKGFIYACDDMYAVNNFTMVEVLLPKVVQRDMGGDFNSSNPWQRDMAKTRLLCVNHNLPLYNYVCHLPVYYEWDKLLAIYDQYDCDHQSYIVENIYFNTYFADRVPFVLDFDKDNFKCGVYRSNPRIWCIENALKSKIWIQNSPEGWIRELDEILSKHYAEVR